jgi:hypothetical protein
MIRLTTCLLLSLMLCSSFVASAHPSLMRCLNTGMLYFGERVCEEKVTCCQVKTTCSITEQNTPVWRCCQGFDLHFEWVMPERISKEIEVHSKLSFVTNESYWVLGKWQYNRDQVAASCVWPPPHIFKHSQDLNSRFCIRIC